MTHFIVVHGIRRKPKPSFLRESCQFYLSQSSGIDLDLDQVRLAYWADLAGHQEINDDRGQLKRFSFGERITLGGLGLARRFVIDHVEARLAALLARKEEPDAGFVVQRLAEVIPMLQDALAADVMRAFIKDVHAYFHAGIREPIKDRLREQLDRVPAGSRVGLISHSMGTVIALDVLLSSPGRTVDWLLTLGSPLGFSAVQSQLGVRAQDIQALRDRVPQWDNVSDPVDPVCFDEDLADDYAAARPNDHGIHNEFAYSSGKRNHHGLYGYLGHSEVGDMVQAFLEDED